MKVYTYQSPFQLTSLSFWNELESAPHLCVSETLVQGLIDCYKRETFRYISTIDGVIKGMFSEWTNGTKNKVQQYLSLSELIRTIDDKNLRNAMLHNRKELLEALRYLFEVEFRPDLINMEAITIEQQVVVELYKRLSVKHEWAIFDSLIEQSDIKDLKYAQLCILAREIKNMFLFEDWDIESSEVTFESIQQKLENYTSSDSQGKSQFDLRYHFLSILQEFKFLNSKPERIVIHGVHQFTPIILHFIKKLEGMGIEVVYLIHYMEDYPRIFNTWKTVYSWPVPSSGAPSFLKSVNQLPITSKPLGRSIGSLLHGEAFNHHPLEVEVYKYSNLSAICDLIGTRFSDAEKKIGQMEEQFYAVSNSSINDLLRSYFPERFKNKQFLSYPIGQFILALYNMWDHENGELIITSENLRECLMIDLLTKNETPANLITIFSKVEAYVKGVESVRQVIMRLEYLIENIQEINSRPILKDLKYFSFYSLTSEEVSYLIGALKHLNKISKELFLHEEGTRFSFQEHFAKLIQVIETEVNDSNYVSRLEIDLIDIIKDRFENITSYEMEGNILDLKETIHYFLNASKENENQAEWLCRNFEQLDGGILLNRNSTFHLTMLSNESMNVKVDDLLPWPLNESFFDYYEGSSTFAKIALQSKKEYKYFLRYSLFYASYFLQNRITLSYVEEKDTDEEETFYFLLDMIGLTPKEPEVEVGDKKVREGDSNPVLRPPIRFNITRQDLEEYSACDYRFFQNRLIRDTHFYQNDFHYIYYLQTIVFMNSWNRISTTSMGRKDSLEKTIEHVINDFKRFFPFIDEPSFFDIYRKVLSELESIMKEEKPEPNQEYLNYRKKFLIASYKEDSFGENLLKDSLNISKSRIRKAKKDQIMNRLRSYLIEEIPDKELTNPGYCNFCNLKNLCLNYYKETTNKV